MVAHGAREEVEQAATIAARGARQALGFQALLDGDVDAMKAETRRYAKRQLTWMRKLPGLTDRRHRPNRRGRRGRGA